MHTARRRWAGRVIAPELHKNSRTMFIRLGTFATGHRASRLRDGSDSIALWRPESRILRGYSRCFSKNGADFFKDMLCDFVANFFVSIRNRSRAGGVEECASNATQTLLWVGNTVKTACSCSRRPVLGRVLRVA